MSPAERYLHDVLSHVPAAFPEHRARIAADLRSHLAESVEAGESEAGAVRRMGPAEQTAATFLEGAPLPLASLADRIGAYIVDNALFLVPVLGALAAISYRDPSRIAALNDPATPADRAIVGTIVIVSVAYAIAYFPILEARYGQTPGKRLFGIAVVKTTGTAVRLPGAIIRRIPKLFNISLLDALFAPFTARRQRAFDIVAGTIVVTSPRAPRKLHAWAAAGVMAALWAAAAAVLISTADRV